MTYSTQREHEFLVQCDDILSTLEELKIKVKAVRLTLSTEADIERAFLSLERPFKELSRHCRQNLNS